MPTPRVLILRAPGTNCDLETAFAFERAGASATVLPLARWLDAPPLAADYQVVCLPGGFSYGDDIGAGRIWASQLRRHLAEVLQEFHASGKLILGICNGFQVLIQSGFLFPTDDRRPLATLTWNDSGRFEDRWTSLSVSGGKNVFLDGVQSMYLPVAHAEGKFVCRDADTLAQLEAAGHLCLRYRAPQGGDGAAPYPFNPNGSEADVAGAVDATGRVFGLMPHPERYIDKTHHPRWTRGEGADPGEGLQIFENAVRYFA